MDQRTIFESRFWRHSSRQDYWFAPGTQSHLQVPRLQWGGEVCLHIEPKQWNSGEGRWGMINKHKKNKKNFDKHFEFLIVFVFLLVSHLRLSQRRDDPVVE